MLQDFQWSQKYAPKSVNDVILPTPTKTMLKEFVAQGSLPNFLFVGSKGIGKTSVARALVKELGADFFFINASLKRNIDVLRTEIAEYASAKSLSGGRKYIILDEADGLGHVIQNALRGFIEQYSKNVSFILTANKANKIIEPIWSRCSVVDFKIPENEELKLKAKFYKRVVEILGIEKIEYDEEVVLELIELYFPDFRRTLNELQRYSSSGKIDSGILSLLSLESIDELVGFMKEKNFTSVRKWVEENSSADPDSIFTTFYEQASSYFKKGSIPALIILLAEYQDKATRVANQEINTAACFANIMCECSFI